MNIRVYNSNGRITEYLAEKYTELYPEPPSKNMGSNASIIELGYYQSYHYIGVVGNEIDQTPLDIITYYTKEIEDDSEQIHTIAFDYHSSQSGDDWHIPLGIYDSENHTIKYFSKKNAMHIKLKQAFMISTEQTPINNVNIKNEALFTPIKYYKDILSGKIYREPSQDGPELGRIKVKNLPDGSTYSKIIFN